MLTNPILKGELHDIVCIRCKQWMGTTIVKTSKIHLCEECANEDV